MKSFAQAHAVARGRVELDALGQVRTRLQRKRVNPHQRSVQQTRDLESVGIADEARVELRSEQPYVAIRSTVTMNALGEKLPPLIRAVKTAEIIAAGSRKQINIDAGLIEFGARLLQQLRVHTMEVCSGHRK